MFVVGRSDNVVGEEARRIIQEAAELHGSTDNTISALSLGVVGSFSIDSDSLLFDPNKVSFHRVNESRTETQDFFFRNYAKCERCGIWHKSYLRIAGHLYCSDECAEYDGHVRCRECGGFVHIDDQLEIEGNIFCSSGCAEDYGFHYCSHCHEWTSRDGSHARGYDWVCDDCLDNSFRYCDHCGLYVHEDSFDYEEEICDSCENRRTINGLIHEYGWTPTIKFFGSTDGNKQPFIGVELEIDSGNDRAQCAKDLSNIDLANRIWLTRDGSLNDGIEVTSHPITLEEHLKCGLWEDVTRVAHSHGFTSHNNGRCGLHLHINRNFFGKSEEIQDVGGYKMMRLMQRFEKQFITFSRRTSTRWCSFSTCEDYSPKPVKVSSLNQDPYSEYNYSSGVIRKAGKMVRDETTHSQAVNFEHRNTFEIRIFRGTLRLSTLYASFALANGLARACKFHGETWIENVSWYDLMAWIIADCSTDEIRNYLLNYLIEKELYFTPDFTASTTVSEEE